MSRSPNSEQALAIESTCGGLLSAGAGSGKTFVIIHHILFLFQRILDEEMSQELPVESKEKNIARRISEIVIMTFTRKAAGEIKHRIQKQLEETLATLDAVDILHWQIIHKYYDYMTVGTIDSFCSKVLKSGVITKIDSQFEVVDQQIKFWELEKILKDELKSLMKRSPDLKPIIVQRFQDILRTFNQIFSDTLVRWTWENFYDKNIEDLIQNESLKNLVTYYNIDDFWNLSIDESLLEECSHLKWYADFMQVRAIKTRSQGNLFDINILTEVLEALGKISRYKAPSGKKYNQTTIEYCESFKNFRNGLKKIGENVLESLKQSKDQDSGLSLWWKILQILFPRVLRKYEKIPQLSFADLNITLLKNLNNSEVLKRIQQKYRYFIIDEFQDTSMIQYEIVRKIVDDNHERIFAVGDRKQAIYGFRGGELAVFNQAQSRTSFSHSLLNNYRSQKQVTDFNNLFFDKMMALGMSWSGEDRFPVVFEAQQTPLEDQNHGQIEALKISEENNWDWESEFIIAKFEAELIFRRIQEEIAKGHEHQIAILYSKIKLSFELIEKLIEANIGFTAQVNLLLDEEPIIELLKLFLIKEKDTQKIDFFELVYSGILKQLGINNSYKAHDIYEFFIDQKRFWGIEIAFHKTLIRMGVSLSSTAQNLNHIKSIIDECLGHEDKILNMLKNRSQGQFKMNLQQGENPERIQIMTAHASKGLEFDLVFLGGIYLNGRSGNDFDLLGKLPGSIQWFRDQDRKKKYQTPQYMMEIIERKEKEFSERKRLFYVAATRAKKNLIWCDFPITKVSAQANAWFVPLKKFKDDLAPLINIQEYDLINTEKLNKTVFKKSELPLFHRDNLGITQRLGESTLDFGIFPEISVTKLAQIALCPRKFYISQVLKISYSELEKFDLKPDEKESEATKISSVSRGIQVHEKIESFLNSDADQSLKKQSDEKNDEHIQWLRTLLSSYPKPSWNYEVERLHKFDLFGYMMTGIPDLVMKSQDSKRIAIWDFKTGEIDPDQLGAYWFQLMLYAWIFKDFETIELSLVFIDEKKQLSKTIDKTDLYEEIDEHLAKLGDLFQKDESHCQVCQFYKLCHKQF